MAGTKATTTVEAAPTAAAPEGTCAVDIRIFLLTITLAMSAAFLTGISVHLPVERFLQAPHNKAASLPPKPLTRLDLSPADLKTAGTHSPSGQHLLVDIKGIEAAFLDSEERLSNAMVQTVQEAGLSMLSYHCHKLDPAGISCVGVLLESHISFHTWPEEGVITLDLFTCGVNPLLPVVPVIERLFGIGDDITTKWSHELRGFRSLEEKKANYLDNFSDLSIWILSPIELHYKKQIYSNLTKYQRVDIWDIAEVRFGWVVLENVQVMIAAGITLTSLFYCFSFSLAGGRYTHVLRRFEAQPSRWRRALEISCTLYSGSYLVFGWNYSKPLLV